MKIKAFFIILVVLFIESFGRVEATDREFFTFVEADYTVDESGRINVRHDISLENATENRYAKSYALQFEAIEATDIEVWQGESKVDYKLSKSDQGIVIEFDFLYPAVGKGKVTEFSVEFVNTTLVEHTGEVWEIYIPKLARADSFDSYRVNLSVPKSFGEPSYISPEPIASHGTGETNVYKFSLGESTGGVAAAFGEFQAFSFNLTYHLENLASVEEEKEIAIVPDTSFQKVFYESIEPEPVDVYATEEGNWIAKYKLAGGARMDVKVVGRVKLYSVGQKHVDFSSVFLGKNLSQTDFWQVGEARIIELAKRLMSPRAIYDYVVGSLDYDYERVRPDVDRRGALGALDNPESSICMEFTDLFIAIARAAGIPAREINGYAYTENPEIQPLGLVADVLHSWPEYWDWEKQIWIPVDPTWGDTTGGVDYFTKLDLRHIAFVIHGIDAYKPYPPGSYKLGDNPQKDVYIGIADKGVIDNTKLEVEFVEPRGVYFGRKKLVAQIVNNGAAAIYDSDFSVYFGSERKEIYNYPVLPPYSREEIEIDVPMGLFSSVGEISLAYGDDVVIYEVNHLKETLVSLIVVFGVLGAIVGLFLVISFKERIRWKKL